MVIARDKIFRLEMYDKKYKIKKRIRLITFDKINIIQLRLKDLHK